MQFEEKPVDAEEGEEEEDEQKKTGEDVDVDEEEKAKGSIEKDQGKSPFHCFRLDPEKKKLTDNENEVDGDVPLDEDEDMDEDEVRRSSRFSSLSIVFSRLLITSNPISIPVMPRAMISMMMGAMAEIESICSVSFRINDQVDLFLFFRSIECLMVSFKNKTSQTLSTDSKFVIDWKSHPP